MKILFLGDSITEGAGASTVENRFVNLTAKKLNADFINYGNGGTRIARQKHVVNGCAIMNYDYNLRLEVMEDEADVVVIFGGTNDFGHGCAPLGNANDTDVYTFYGATETLFKNAVAKYGKEKIIVIIPLPRANDDSIFGDSPDYKFGVRGTLKDYNDIIIEKANKYGLKYVNYAKYFPKSVIGTKDDVFLDGLHPNDKGHALLADLLAEDIKKLLK